MFILVKPTPEQELGTVDYISSIISVKKSHPNQNSYTGTKTVCRPGLSDV